MSINAETRKSPYEIYALLQGGKLSGAHVKFIYEVVEPDAHGNLQVIAATIGPAMPVDVGQGKGFPVDVLLDAILVGAIAAADAAKDEAEKARAAAAESATVSQNAKAEAERLAGDVRRLEEAAIQQQEKLAQVIAKAAQREAALMAKLASDPAGAAA